MKICIRALFGVTVTAASFLALSGPMAAVASAHTKLISTPADGPILYPLNLAISSNMPVGTGNQWRTYFPSVPANTGIFAMKDSSPRTAGWEIYSWFDTTGTPSPEDTTGAGVSMTLQGQSTGYDTPWLLTNAGTVWYNSSPQGPGETWGSWTQLGGVVPGFPPAGDPGDFHVSVLDSSDTPWVLNGDGICDGNHDSTIYHWNALTKNWVTQKGCLYNLAEEADCLIGVGFDSKDNTHLWTSNNSTVEWTDLGVLLEPGGEEEKESVGSLAVTGSTNSVLQVYFTDRVGNLREWSGSCSTLIVPGSIQTVVPTQVGATFVQAVARDWAGGTGTQNVYYVNNNEGGSQEVWQL